MKSILAGGAGLATLGIIFGLSAVVGTGGPETIQATLKCPIPGKHPKEISQAVPFSVGPSPCDYHVLGDICRTLIMTEITCTWEGLSLGGQRFSKSLWHGQGYTEGDGSKSVVTQGYDWGVSGAGDNYLARWTETMAPGLITANWNLVFGTGSLDGIIGEAVISCDPPKPVDTMEVCNVSGTYRLPD